MNSLTLTTSTLTSEISKIDCSGEIDCYTVGQLRDVVKNILAQNIDPKHNLCVDLSGVEYLDASALGMLVGTKKKFMTRGGDIFLVIPTPRINRIFEITGLNKVFEIHKSQDAAIAALNLQIPACSVA